MWNRRQFLWMSGGALAAWPGPRSPGPVASVTLFLGGDVMTGRGIDQVLARPSSPRLHEAYVGSALGYVELAERAHGRISRPVTFSYVWGDLLSDLERRSPDLRIVNLEISVTTSEDALPKGINYRMHPANVPCLAAAKIDCCVLANNHVLDWGTPGLRETLAVLATAEIATAGAGRSAEDAGRPAVLDTSGKGRVLVFGFGMPSSGIPHDWAASDTRPGVNLLPDSSPRSVSRAVERMGRWRRPGDRIVASIHWGGNWGYHVPREERELAHRLIEGGVDVVHGHSSHHAKGIEIYQGDLCSMGVATSSTTTRGSRAKRSSGVTWCSRIWLRSTRRGGSRAWTSSRIGSVVSIWSGRRARTPGGCGTPWAGKAGRWARRSSSRRTGA